MKWVWLSTRSRFAHVSNSRHLLSFHLSGNSGTPFCKYQHKRRGLWRWFWQTSSYTSSRFPDQDIPVWKQHRSTAWAEWTRQRRSLKTVRVHYFFETERKIWLMNGSCFHFNGWDFFESSRPFLLVIYFWDFFVNRVIFISKRKFETLFTWNIFL